MFTSTEDAIGVGSPVVWSRSRSKRWAMSVPFVAKRRRPAAQTVRAVVDSTRRRSSGASSEATNTPASSGWELRTPKMKLRPSGRKLGQEWPVSPRVASRVVIAVGSPPFAGTLNSFAPMPPSAKRIVSEEPHVPPSQTLSMGRAARRCTAPSERLTRRISPSAKNARAFPSGDPTGR